MAHKIQLPAMDRSGAPTGNRQRKRVVLLGATGSIGESALRVLAEHRDRLELTAVASRSNWRRLASIAAEFGVRRVGLYDDKAYAAAKESGEFKAGTRIAGGPAGLTELATLEEADIVLVRSWRWPARKSWSWPESS
jgi:1-deoxy-D-xylulose-5-phosphate reductoisomerase